MVNRKGNLSWSAGFSLIEALIVITMLAVLLISFLSVFKPASQINKASDARRKSDLDRLRVAFEEYYDDHNCYPNFSLECGSTDLAPYLEKITCDPEGDSYFYSPAAPTSCPQSFRIYTILKNSTDSSIAKVGCTHGCGPAGSPIYNYCVCSTNVDCQPGPIPTETPAPPLPSPTPTPECAYICIPGSGCTPWCGPIPESCPKYHTENCGGPEVCQSPANQCRLEE